MENSNGTVHPGDNFPEKSNTFRGITLSRFHQNDRNFLYHLFGLQSVLSEQESTKGIAFIRNEARACSEIFEIKTKPSKKPRQQQAFNCKKLEQNICRCPAFGRLCLFCKEKNHYAKMCPQKNPPVHMVDSSKHATSDGQVESEELFIEFSNLLVVACCLFPICLEQQLNSN